MSAFARLFDPIDGGTPVSVKTERGEVTSMSCTTAIGRYGAAGRLSVVADVVGQGSAERLFTRERELAAPVAGAPEIGTSAYSHRDPTGWHVVAYDGNLQVNAGFRPNASPRPDQNPVPALSQVCVSVMTALMVS